MSGSTRPIGSSTRKRSRSPGAYASRSSGSTQAIGAFTSTSRRSRSQLCCYLPVAVRESISGAPTESIPHLAEEPVDVGVEETVETRPEMPSSSVRVPTSPRESPPFMFLTTLAAVISVYGRS